MQTDVEQPSFLRLSFVIVGGGVGGLSTALCLARAGHTVTVLESSAYVAEIGAGIQLAPNATRILNRLGAGDFLREDGVKPVSLVFRRYANGDILTTYSLEDVEEKFGAPYCTVHRGQLVQKLHELASQNDLISVRFGCVVKSIDPGSDNSEPFVTLANEEKIKADAIIGADGIRSITREVVTGAKDRPIDTGDAAYRALIPAELMLSDPDLASFIQHPEVNAWLGPGRHLVAYCVNGGKEYNVVTAHPDSGAIESWTLEGSADIMREDFSTFEPRVKKLLNLIQSTHLWKLLDRDPLAKWVHPSGKVILVGDACHPMLPHRAQGAAMAIEDAATLGEIYLHVRSKDDIVEFNSAFERLRSPRCVQAQGGSRMNQKIFHLPDGPLQQGRDAQLGQAVSAIAQGFNYDPISEVEAWWQEKSGSKL